jgi:hypothetical protein
MWSLWSSQSPSHWESFPHFVLSLPSGPCSYKAQAYKPSSMNYPMTSRPSTSTARSARRQIPPGDVRALSMRANTAQDWAGLPQAALNRLKEENAGPFQRVAMLKADGVRPFNDLPSITDVSTADSADRIKALVPHANGRQYVKKWHSWKTGVNKKINGCSNYNKCSLPRLPRSMRPSQRFQAPDSHSTITDTCRSLCRTISALLFCFSLHGRIF